ncbi:MAG: hypothetical protein KBI47_19170 [Armatimonadetes bacterium]|jgi:prepilin-type processing-associated H-X9-DG protein|nr:hypothetical protein [Armatimonadota bacterium]
MNPCHNGGSNIVMVDGHVKWFKTGRDGQFTVQDNLTNPAHWNPTL